MCSLRVETLGEIGDTYTGDRLVHVLQRTELDRVAIELVNLRRVGRNVGRSHALRAGYSGTLGEKPR